MNWITGELENNTIEAEEIKNHTGRVVKIHGSIYKVRKMSNFCGQRGKFCNASIRRNVRSLGKKS